jgi:hypothetical protein
MARRHRVVPVAIAAAAFVVLVAAVLFLFGPRARSSRPASLGPAQTGTLNILIIGKDARAVGPVSNEGRQRNKREDQSHSDIIVICHINFELPAVNLVAIPRDMLVEVPGITSAASNTDFNNMEKITHTFAIGGEKLLRRTVENFLGIRIQRSIAFDFDTFRMTFGLLRPFLGVLRVAGVNLADRNQALMFARKRYGLKFDDADRCRNAVSFIRAVVGRTWWLAGTRVGDMLIGRTLAVVGPDTDLNIAEIRGIIGSLAQRGFVPGRIRTAVVVSEGAEVTLNRYHQTLSCYLPAYREIEKQVDHYLRDRKDVTALDFMTQQNFRVPAFYEYNYVTLSDSFAPQPESVTTDTLRLETRLIEVKEAGLARDSLAVDSGK